MTGPLAGRVALVTGAGRGLGAATASLLATAGARVVLADVLVDELGSVGREIESAAGAGTTATAHLDVSSEEGWQQVARCTEDTFGGLDILVNNAGTSAPPVGLEAMDVDDWHRVLAVNLTGAMLGMRTVIPLLRRRGGGAIVNVASMYGVVAADSSPAYQASKGGVRMLTKAAALQYGPENIRVNTVNPGLTDTAILAAQGPERIAARLTRTPLHRVASPMEVARSIVFLASDESSFVTGADLLVDGGYTAC
jgi:NAD(P)-dependent dehydrogenase (short-subunit alcohol dehydrogenase family)